jgi:hypothetical protein
VLFSTSVTIKTRKGGEVAMRIRKAFFPFAALVATGLLAATGAMAQAVTPPGPPPPECSTYTFSAKAYGPTPVSDCIYSSTGQCTEIKYEISGDRFKSTDHAFAVEGLGVAYVKNEVGQVCATAGSNGSCKIFDPCDGDNLSEIGEDECHQQVTRVDANSAKSITFTVGLAGQRGASLASLIVKKGKKTEACPILGIGFESAASPLATVTPDTYEVLGGKCLVHVHTDNTGTKVVSAEPVDPKGNYDCDVSEPMPVGSVQVDVNDSGPQPVEFSEGFSFILGPGSCTYKQYYPPAGAIYRICY